MNNRGRLFIHLRSCTTATVQSKTVSDTPQGNTPLYTPTHLSGLRLPLIDDHCFQVIPLLHLRLDFLYDRHQIWVVLIGYDVRNRLLLNMSASLLPLASFVDLLEAIDVLANTATSQPMVQLSTESS